MVSHAALPKQHAAAIPATAAPARSASQGTGLSNCVMPPATAKTLFALFIFLTKLSQSLSKNSPFGSSKLTGLFPQYANILFPITPCPVEM